jgi:hypothetical protein
MWSPNYTYNPGIGGSGSGASGAGGSAPPVNPQNRDHRRSYANYYAHAQESINTLRDMTRIIAMSQECVYNVLRHEVNGYGTSVLNAHQAMPTPTYTWTNGYGRGGIAGNPSLFGNLNTGFREYSPSAQPPPPRPAGPNNAAPGQGPRGNADLRGGSNLNRNWIYNNVNNPNHIPIYTYPYHGWGQLNNMNMNLNWNRNPPGAPGAPGGGGFWSNVRVNPTDAEIAAATSTVPYSAELPHQSCPITMENFNSSSRILRINQCGHLFNESGLRRWFRNHVTCPVCRLDIREAGTGTDAGGSGNSNSETNSESNNEINNGSESGGESGSESDSGMPPLISDSESESESDSQPVETDADAEAMDVESDQGGDDGNGDGDGDTQPQQQFMMDILYDFPPELFQRTGGANAANSIMTEFSNIIQNTVNDMNEEYRTRQAAQRGNGNGNGSGNTNNPTR